MQLERELLYKPIGNCSGLTVLDLGGGDGVYARRAVEQGAKVVDLVDISKAMPEVQPGRADEIKRHIGDATRALRHVPLESEDDMVMCNWVLDHATTEEVH